MSRIERGIFVSALSPTASWRPGVRRHKCVDSWRGLEFAGEKAILFYLFARAAAGTIAYVPLVEGELWRPGQERFEGAEALSPPDFRELWVAEIRRMASAITDARR